MARKENLYSTDNYTREDFEDYVKYLTSEDNDNYNVDDEHDYWQWIEEQQRLDFEDLIVNLKYSAYGKNSVMVVGTLGLWYGKRDIEPTYFENVEKAIYACISNCELQSVERVGNTIEIVVAHHDGRNCFTLVFLSDKGHERYMRNGKVSLNNRENIKKIGDFIF
jgi:hypothetical protein